MSTPITIQDVYDLFRASQAEMAASRAEFQERLVAAKAEADRRSSEVERTIAEIRATGDRAMKAVDALTTRWGRFVEELVEPAVLTLFQDRGIDIKEVYPRVRNKRQGLAMEIDILGVDDGDVVLVECKSRLSKDDVDEFLAKLRRFKQAFPHYADYQVYGAVAGIEINEGIDPYAYKQGLFVIKPSGEGVAIANDADFQAITW